MSTSGFDLNLGEELKEEGIDRAAARRARALATARQIAHYIARRDGTVTADDVQEMMIRFHQPHLRNAAGALFRGEEWEFTGEWRKSARITNHARQNRVWRLR